MIEGPVTVRVLWLYMAKNIAGVSVEQGRRELFREVVGDCVCLGVDAFEELDKVPFDPFSKNMVFDVHVAGFLLCGL